MPNQRPTKHPYWEADESSLVDSADTITGHYRDVQLAPSVPESLVTWDVSGHAQCEKDRMSSAYRTRGEMHRGY